MGESRVQGQPGLHNETAEGGELSTQLHYGSLLNVPCGLSSSKGEANTEGWGLVPSGRCPPTAPHQTPFCSPQDADPSSPRLPRPGPGSGLRGRAGFTRPRVPHGPSGHRLRSESVSARAPGLRGRERGLLAPRRVLGDGHAAADHSRKHPATDPGCHGLQNQW